MITLATCEDQTEPENGRRQEECGDMLEAVAVMQVRRDSGGLLWGGKMEMEKGRIREVEWKGKMVENGWFWEKKRNHYDAQNPVWPRRKMVCHLQR